MLDMAEVAKKTSQSVLTYHRINKERKEENLEKLHLNP
jgi:hypothetical protein